ncbi:lipoprotein-releasing ABC transporter permease subunit [Neptunicella marina]|uniref:Lipoprotein-releasing ABC transporter permease subunit n=1 Tax=Neptunicella marina TaxID=2125989 RepID=A0A8J6IX83_9ALTE|nr:lipoprotein-releasing ABC transporter permease subunit [Neptunicella marina]MBC3767013.1 lipoprotein-releasing ABC transporter permease subunit [Neptunicella marina]
MFSLSWQLAWRFRRDKRQSGFISFISASSTLGIALGCFTLILILSVMNGFEQALEDELLNIIPHGEITAVNTQGLQNWQAIQQQYAQDPHVVFTQPVIKLTGLLQQGAEMKAVEVTAIDSALYRKSPLFKAIDIPDWPAFASKPHSIMLGSGVMKQLNVSVGDKVQLLLPQFGEQNQLLAPKSQWLEVAGSISMGGELDKHIALMHLQFAKDIVSVDSGAQALQFYFDDAFIAPLKTRQIGFSLAQHVYISDWTRTQGHLYQDILLVRWVVYVVLTLVIAVACFNIVSAQMMAVAEKQAEIAMLKTMGAANPFIIRTFVYQGAINGILGTLFGSLAGVVCAWYVSDIARAIEKLTGHAFLSGDVYFIDFLPSQLQWPDVIFTVSIALCLSLLATLFPAIKAAKIEPAKVLGH